MLGTGTGKSSALVAEQIAFQQPGGHCRAVHLYHAAIATPAQVMNSAGNKLLAGAGLAQNQHRTVAVRDHLHLLHHRHHWRAAANNFAKIGGDVIDLLGEGEVLVDQPLLKMADFAVGEGVIHGNGDAFGNLIQQFQIRSRKHLRFALGQLQGAEDPLAEDQREQAQGLILFAPHIKQHAFVRGVLIAAVQIKHQHLFVTHDFFRQRAFLVHLALIVQRGVFIQIMGGVDQELALALAAQHHADGINAEVALDLPGNLRHQLVEVEFRQHRVSDGNQQTKVVAFPAQHLIAVAAILAGHQLLDCQARRLGQRL